MIVFCGGAGQSHVPDTDVTRLSAPSPRVPGSRVSVLITMPRTCHDSAGPHVTETLLRTWQLLFSQRLSQPPSSEDLHC